jgi:hypothetical protein
MVHKIKIITSIIFKTFIISVLMIAQVHFAYAQSSASILPPAKTSFFDINGNPLSSGKVFSYIPGTTTPKTTWQDAAETIPNANPVVLDAAGRALILGSGNYRQIVQDKNSNQQWDQVTSSTGSGGGTGPIATGDGDLVGTVKPWAGMTAPNQYLFTYGQEVSRTLFPALFTAITSSQAVFCNSGSPILNGLGDTTNFWIGMTVEVSCLGAGFSTIISKTSTTVTMAANANVTTNVTAIFFPWGRGNGTTTFNLPDFRGNVLAGNTSMGGVISTNLTSLYFGSKGPNSSGAIGGSQSYALNTQAYLPNVNFTTTASSNPTSYLFGTSITSSVTAGGSTIGVQSGTAGVSVVSVTGSTPSGGGGLAASATVGAGGSGYTAGTQLLTVSGGTCSVQPTFNVTISAGAITAPVLASAGYCTVPPSNAAATTGGGGTGGTLNITYAALPFATIQPTITTNYIIKVTPDTNSATASGVTSLGGMTGDIACGSGVTCTGNILSFSASSSNISFTQTGTGAVVSTVDAKIKQNAISVKDFGALCDGVTDDSNNIMLADAAAAAQGKALYFPAGTCMAQGLNPVRSNLEWFGDGPYLSKIKAVNPGIGFDTLAWFGPRLATTQILNDYVHDLGFDGNTTGTNAVVEARNVTFSRFNNLYIINGGAAGFRTDTSTTTINTVTVRNHYVEIETASNVGKGFYLNGEKDSEVNGLFSHNNTSDGVYFGPANLNSSALCETTQLYGGAISSRDNGGDGIVFDEAEKFVLSSIQTSINAGYGLRFLSSITGCTSTGSNSVNIANLVARNDSLGAIRAADNAYVYGAAIGTLWARGDNSTVGSTAVELDGVASFQFGSVDIQGWPGTVIRLKQGTPLSGGVVQSNNITFGQTILVSNGNVAAVPSHGITIENTSNAIMINSLISANSQTSGTNFEVNVASGASALISAVKLNASGGSGNNIQAPAGALLQIFEDINAPAWNANSIIVGNGINAPIISAGTARLGGSDAASPVAQTLQVQNVLTGTANIAGANTTISASQGTGTGIGGNIIFKTAIAGGAGSTQNALVTAMTIAGSIAHSGTGSITMGNCAPTGVELFINAHANCTNVTSGATGIDLQIAGGDGSGAQSLFDSFGANSEHQFRRANGTAAAKTGLVANDIIGAITGLGYLSTGAYSSIGTAQILFKATETWSGTAQGTAINLVTTANGSVTPTIALTAQNNDVTIGATPCTTALFVVNVGTGCPTPQSGATVQEISSGASMLHEFDAYGTGVASQLWGRSATGTSGTPLATGNGQLTVQLLGQGFDGSAWGAGVASVAIKTSQVFSAGANGQQVEIRTVPNGTAAGAVAATFQNSGGVSIGTSTDLGIGTLLANSTIKSLSTTASTSSTTGSGLFGGGLGVAGAIYAGAEVVTAAVAVASLPTCNAAHKAARHFVTDANATFTAGIGAVVAAGGANNVPVTCDGTNWRIG